MEQKEASKETQTLEQVVDKMCQAMEGTSTTTPKPKAAVKPANHELVNLTRYRVQTYSVSLVAEPEDKSAIKKYQSAKLTNAGKAFKFAELLFSQIPLDRDREHFLLLALNNKNRFEGFKVVSTGHLTASLVNPREVYHAAIVLRAAGVVFVHNHPSGDPEPSAGDIDTTRDLKEVGRVLGVRVLDHIIMGDGRYFSFNDKGIL